MLYNDIIPTVSFHRIIQMHNYPVSLEKLYAELSQADIDRQLTLVINDISTNARLTEPYETILRYLISYTNAPLGNLMELMCKHRIFNVPMAFLGASDAICKQLLQYADIIPEKTINLNQWLLCLAWIGNDAVVEQFAAWRNRPPIWSKVLYVPPHAYAPSAGWELTPDGKRRNLYFSQGIRLSKQGSASSDTRLASILSKAGQTLFPDATLPIISTANWGDLNEDYSQIGGLPSWVQDAEYPSCPECDTTMMYFAQFALSTLEPSDEGIYYMFICNDCQMSAASYQQS